MQRRYWLLLVVVVLLGLDSPALAEERLQANVALVSDYVFRGISRTDNKAALQAGAEYNHSVGLYAGLWGSSTDTINDSDFEIDMYAGYADELPSLRLGWDVGLISYRHNKSKDNRSEIYTGVSLDPWPRRMSLVARLSYDWEEENTFIEALAGFQLGGGVKLNVQPGYGDIHSNVDGAGEDYGYLRLGVAKAFPLAGTIKSIDAEISYSDTDLDPGGDTTDNLWWVSLKANF